MTRDGEVVLWLNPGFIPASLKVGSTQLGEVLYRARPLAADDEMIAALKDARAQLQTIRDWMMYEANSEGGKRVKIDTMLARLDRAGGGWSVSEPVVLWKELGYRPFQDGWDENPAHKGGEDSIEGRWLPLAEFDALLAAVREARADAAYLANKLTFCDENGLDVDEDTMIHAKRIAAKARAWLDANGAS